MPAVITWAVQVDTTYDGTWATDITGRISRASSGISISRGLNDEGVYQTSQLTLGVENADGEWTPEYSSSAIFPIEPGLPVRVRATHNAVTATLWAGYVADISASWEAGTVPVTQVTCVDIADYLRRYGAVHVVGSTTRDTDGAITAILTAAGVGASLYSLDDGVQDLPFHFVGGQDAIAAIMDCVYSELGGLFWVNKSGVLRFESRTSRTGLTVDRTWGDGTNIFPRSVRYEARADDLLSTVEIQATYLQADQLEQEVFRFSRGSHNNPADSLALTAGQIYECDYFYDAPVLTLTTPVASTDYLANSAIDGSGTDKTSALTVSVTDKGGKATVKLTNTDAATVYVTAFRLRAIVYTFINDKPAFVSSKSIPGQPSDQSAAMQIPFCDNTSAVQDYSMQSLRTHRYPVPRWTLVFDLQRHDDIAASLLACEIGELVLYKDTGLGATVGSMTNEWLYIESIRYGIAAGEVTTAEVTLLPTYAYRDLAKISYDLFTRADSSTTIGTSLSGDAWSNGTDYDIVSNKAQANTGAGKKRAWVDVSTANMVVEVTIGGLDGAVNEALGICYRLADADNYWVFNTYNQAVYLTKRVAAAETVVAGPLSFTPAASHEMKVIVQGNRHRCYLDRTLVIDATDSALNTNTKAGLFADSITAGRTHDDFYAQGL